MIAVGVRRDDVFSPNSVEKDLAILKEVLDNLADEGWQTRLVDENRLRTDDRADIYFSMARGAGALKVLSSLENSGCKVINSPRGIANCQRSKLDALMRQNNVPMPPESGYDGWWLKRGDAAAQSKEDIVFCPDEEALRQAKERFLQRGIDNFVVSSHVKGDLVKFYGVANGFFRFFYPTDVGDSKFGDEAINGKAHHYEFDQESLQSDVERLAQLVGVAVYGGDAIINAEGEYFIIDFNDWPSFSRCRAEAAKAIAKLAK